VRGGQVLAVPPADKIYPKRTSSQKSARACSPACWPALLLYLRVRGGRDGRIGLGGWAVGHWGKAAVFARGLMVCVRADSIIVIGSKYHVYSIRVLMNKKEYTLICDSELERLVLVAPGLPAQAGHLAAA
jgi:hypothetical protein